MPEAVADIQRTARQGADRLRFQPVPAARQRFAALRDPGRLALERGGDGFRPELHAGDTGGLEHRSHVVGQAGGLLLDDAHDVVGHLQGPLRLRPQLPAAGRPVDRALRLQLVDDIDDEKRHPIRMGVQRAHEGLGEIGPVEALLQVVEDLLPGQRLQVQLAAQAMQDAVRVAAGDYHSLALLANGTVVAWGYNEQGQIGDGTVTGRSTAVPVPGLADVVDIATGSFHSMAARGNGTVFAWGDNEYGQVGDGTTDNRAQPTQVTGLGGAQRVFAGGGQSFALLADATLRAWGFNGNGELGDGTTTQRPTPTTVATLTDVRTMSAGYAHSLAVTGTGRGWAWGGNTNGRLGDGTTTTRSAPVESLGEVRLP